MEMKVFRLISSKFIEQYCEQKSVGMLFKPQVPFYRLRGSRTPRRHRLAVAQWGAKFILRAKTGCMTYLKTY